MNQDEVESQLSAMYDGELPAAECELLSRRIDRDENLRARWARYALIGAAMRSEPVATARSGFAVRVSAALDEARLDGRKAHRTSTPRRAKRGQRHNLLWSAALAATLVAGVAGLSISMLREAAMRGAAPLAELTHGSSAPAAPGAPAVDAALMAASTRGAAHGPLSYVTPAGTANAANILRTQLADYIVAHSAYSTPLLRRNLLSELVTSEDQLGIASSYAGAARAAQGTPAGEGDAIRTSSHAGR